MKIVIAGAGAVGFHLAELLARENQDITLIDNDAEVLNHAGAKLDVLTIKGDASSIQTLTDAEVDGANLFIAVTTSEKTNLLTAILAKQIGAKTTIARIYNDEYLQPKQKEKFAEVGIDQFISPEILAAEEITKLLKQASFTDMFEFENGKLSVVGFTLDTSSPIVNKTIAEVDAMDATFLFRGIALVRDRKTIIPKANTILRKGDHLYISTQKKCLDSAIRFVGKQIQSIKTVMIIGGTSLSLKTAQRLEQKYKVTVVMEDKEICKIFAERLTRALVVNANPSNIQMLKEEGLERMDAFIALTPNSETNIVTSLMAEEVGVYKTIALVDNVDYTHISQNIGIDTMINKKLIAANDIFRHVRKGRVEAFATLQGVEAEMIEFAIHKKKRLLKYPLKELDFPEGSIIAGVIRGKESYIPDGDFRFELNDKVIVLTTPSAVQEIERIFA